MDDTRDRNACDLRGAAADVDDQIPPGGGDRQPGADRGGHGLLDQVHVPRARLEDGVSDGQPLHFGDPGGDPDHHARAQERARPPAGLGNEVAEHPARDVEIGDHPVLQRPNHHDVSWRPADHRLGIAPDREQRVIRLPNRDDRRLVEDDALAPHEHHRVGGAEVDAEVRRHRSG